MGGGEGLPCKRFKQIRATSKASFFFLYLLYIRALSFPGYSTNKFFSILLHVHIRKPYEVEMTYESVLFDCSSFSFTAVPIPITISHILRIRGCLSAKGLRTNPENKNNLQKCLKNMHALSISHRRTKRYK